MGFKLAINPVAFKNQIEQFFQVIRTRSGVGEVQNASAPAEANSRPTVTRPLRPPLVHIVSSSSASSTAAVTAVSTATSTVGTVSTSTSTVGTAAASLRCSATARSIQLNRFAITSSSSNSSPEGSSHFAPTAPKRILPPLQRRPAPLPRLSPSGPVPVLVEESLAPAEQRAYTATPALPQSGSSAVTDVRTKNPTVRQSFVGESSSIDVPPAKAARRTESGNVHAAAGDAASVSSCEVLEVVCTSKDTPARAEQHREHPTAQELRRALSCAFYN